MVYILSLIREIETVGEYWHHTKLFIYTWRIISMYF